MFGRKNYIKVQSSYAEHKITFIKKEIYLLNR